MLPELLNHLGGNLQSGVSQPRFDASGKFDGNQIAHMGGELACIDFIDDIDDIAVFEVAEQRRAFDFVLPARAVVVVDAHERQEVGGQPVGVRPAERRIVGEPGEAVARLRAQLHG